MRRHLRQMSFADGLVNQRAGRNEWLDDIGKIIEWSAVETVLSGIYSSDEGRASYPILTFVKLLLLQQWYCLSDLGLEEAADDRLSFRRFAGIPLDEGVPDHSTIWRFVVIWHLSAPRGAYQRCPQFRGRVIVQLCQSPRAAGQSAVNAPPA